MDKSKHTDKGDALIFYIIILTFINKNVNKFNKYLRINIIEKKTEKFYSNLICTLRKEK